MSTKFREGQRGGKACRCVLWFYVIKLQKIHHICNISNKINYKKTILTENTRGWPRRSRPGESYGGWNHNFDAVALGGIAFCLHGSNFFLIFAEFSLAKERQWISSCIALYKKNTIRNKKENRGVPFHGREWEETCARPRHFHRTRLGLQHGGRVRTGNQVIFRNSL